MLGMYRSFWLRDIDFLAAVVFCSHLTNFCQSVVLILRYFTENGLIDGEC